MGMEAVLLKDGVYWMTVFGGSPTVTKPRTDRFETKTGITTWAARKLSEMKRLNAVLFERASLRTGEFSAFSEVERCFRPRYPSASLRRALSLDLFSPFCVQDKKDGKATSSDLFY